MTQIILLQSFRQTDVPLWIELCRTSVEAFAHAHSWTYRFQGDDFFDRAPSWARQACGEDIWKLSDICRLEWIMEELAAGAEVVIWADIDMLIFAPEHIGIDVTRDHGFSHELRFDQTGIQHSVNNALMFFRNDSAQIRAYREASYAALRQNKPLARTALGPDLLTTLKINPAHVITGCGILNYRMMQLMQADPQGRLPQLIAQALPWPLGAANLCLNERRFFTGPARAEYDKCVERTARMLLAQRRA